MKIYLFIIKFLFIGALFIVSNNNLALDDVASREVFFDSFLAWLNTLKDHSFQIAGYVVNSGWLPGDGHTGPLETIG